MEKFKKQFSHDLWEQVPEGCLEAERLKDVVTQEEADTQRRQKPGPACQHGTHLDGKLTLQTRRRFTSIAPADVQQLRAKCTVLENMRLLGHLRQPGMFKDLTLCTFRKLLEDPPEQTQLQ